jgi:hypothetical protein
MPTAAVVSAPAPTGTAELTGYGAITAEAARDLALGLVTTGNDRRSDEFAARLTAGTEPGTPIVEAPTDGDPATEPHGHDPAGRAGPGRLGFDHDGYARKLVAEPRWRRLLTDPATGAAAELSTESYKPTAALAEFVRARDRHCVFPGCLRPAASCDIDHRMPYPNGTTSAENLNCLCRHHHRLKQQPGWTLTKHGEHYVWTNPGGILYLAIPDPVQEPDPAPIPAARPPIGDPPPF